MSIKKLLLLEFDTLDENIYIKRYYQKNSIEYETLSQYCWEDITKRFIKDIKGSYFEILHNDFKVVIRPLTETNQSMDFSFFVYFHCMHLNSNVMRFNNYFNLMKLHTQNENKDSIVKLQYLSDNKYCFYWKLNEPNKNNVYKNGQNLQFYINYVVKRINTTIKCIFYHSCLYELDNNKFKGNSGAKFLLDYKKSIR